MPSGRKRRTKGPATLDDVVRQLGLVSSQLELLKRLIAKFMIYHGVRQRDVAKALNITQGHVSVLVGGAGSKRQELKKKDEEK